MREKFKTISDGGYADILFAQFGKARVEKELDDFLKRISSLGVEEVLV